MSTARIFTIIAMGLLIPACGAPRPSGTSFVTTINPLRAILAEITGDRAEVTALVTPGVSPHTYEPRPSDAAKSRSALALFYAADSIDGWAARLQADQRIEMFALVPEEMRLPWADTIHAGDGHEHDHGDLDGHFWSDPLVVKAVLPQLVARLSSLDPDGAALYAENASRFAASLEELDRELKTEFKDFGGRPVIMFHPSWNYFMHRYDLDVAGMIEPEPGKENTIRSIEALVEEARKQDVRAIFTEPQLPRHPAEVVARAANLPLHELDPNGGSEGRVTYEELIMYNANQLRKALQ